MIINVTDPDSIMLSKNAKKEFACDYIAGLMTSEKGMQEMAQKLIEMKGEKEARNIFERPADFIKEFMESLSRLVRESKNSPAVKMGQNTSEDIVANMRQQVFDVFGQAVENYKASEEANAINENINEKRVTA